MGLPEIIGWLLQDGCVYKLTGRCMCAPTKLLTNLLGCIRVVGTSQVIPSHPDGSLGCDGQLGSG